MQWYQIFGWASAALGALMAGPGVVKLVARPKNWRTSASLGRSTFSGLILVCQSLALATGALWAEIVAITLMAAYCLVWVNNVRAQRRQKNVT